MMVLIWRFSASRRIMEIKAISFIFIMEMKNMQLQE